MYSRARHEFTEKLKQYGHVMVVIEMFNLNHVIMKSNQNSTITGNEQGKPTSDRAYHSVKDDKKQQGITNGGGQRSDQTSNKDNARKREKN